MTLYRGAYTNHQIQFRTNAVWVSVFVAIALVLGTLIVLALGEPTRPGARTFHAMNVAVATSVSVMIRPSRRSAQSAAVSRHLG